MRYRVFVCGSDGRLAYKATSSALGDGQAELALIIEAHALMTGDLIYINDFYYKVVDGGCIVLQLHDSSHNIDGDPWGQDVAKRLYRLVVRAGG
jgi:hypothetical protein